MPYAMLCYAMPCYAVTQHRTMAGGPTALWAPARKGTQAKGGVRGTTSAAINNNNTNNDIHHTTTYYYYY